MTRRSFVKTGAVAAAGATALSTRLGSNFVFADANAKVRIGVVGCGKRGAEAARACAKIAGAQVTALADVFQAQVDALKGELKVATALTGLDAAAKLLALKDVDAVILASPSAFRPQQFAAAIEAGKHVFIEAPAAICITGVKMVQAASAKATEKKLSVVSGLNGRHDPACIETMKRIKDGAIGTIQSAQCYWNLGVAEAVKKEANLSDVENQLLNWRSYVWLSGDHILDRHVNNLDILNWAFNAMPDSVHGLGGRQCHKSEEYGNVYDHFGVEYTYPNDIRTISMCRTIEGTEERIGERLAGTKGTSNGRGVIEGASAWKYDGAKVDPLVQALTDLVKGIQAGAPVSDGQAAAESALTAVIGRESCYSRLQFKRSYFEAKCTQSLLPPQDLKFGPMPVTPPAMPGPYVWEGFQGDGGKKKK
jgi:predicted dehydrogenase